MSDLPLAIDLCLLDGANSHLNEWTDKKFESTYDIFCFDTPSVGKFICPTSTYPSNKQFCSMCVQTEIRPLFLTCPKPLCFRRAFYSLVLRGWCSVLSVTSTDTTCTNTVIKVVREVDLGDWWFNVLIQQWIGPCVLEQRPLNLMDGCAERGIGNDYCGWFQFCRDISWELIVLFHTMIVF